MDPDQTALIWVHSICLHDKTSLWLHLNICSRRNKQTTFSGQKKNWLIKLSGVGITNHFVFLCLNVVFICENFADPD